MEECIMYNSFFILGYPRSGTTLFRAMLNSHSKIAIPFESFTLLEYSKRVSSEYNNLSETADRVNFLRSILNSKGIGEWKPKVTIEDINTNLCVDFTSTIEQVFTAYATKCGKSVWGDKTPSYTKDLHMLCKFFPHSRFIHLIRDCRDVEISYSRQPWGLNSFNSIIEEWKEIVSCTRKIGSILGQERYLEIRFEDLVENPKATLSKTLDFLNLPYEDSVLRENGGTIDHLLPDRSKGFHTNLSKPPDNRFAYKWKKELNDADQVLCGIIAGELLDELNYPQGCKKVNILKLQGRRSFHYINQALNWRISKLKNKLYSVHLHRKRRQLKISTNNRL